MEETPPIYKKKSFLVEFFFSAKFFTHFCYPDLRLFIPVPRFCILNTLSPSFCAYILPSRAKRWGLKAFEADRGLEVGAVHGQKGQLCASGERRSCPTMAHRVRDDGEQPHLKPEGCEDEAEASFFEAKSIMDSSSLRSSE